MTKKDALRYFILDFLSAIIVWTLFYIFRRVTHDHISINNTIEIIPTPTYNLWLSMICYPILSVCIYYLSGYYNLKTNKSRIIEFITTVISSIIISVIAFFTIMIDDKVVSYTVFYKSFFVLLIIHFAITYTVRICQTQYKFNMLKSGKITYNTLIIGTGKAARNITEATKNKIRKYGQKIVGYVSIGNPVEIDPELILGHTNNLENIIKEHNIAQVIIAIENMDENIIFEYINRLLKMDVEIFFIPRLFEIVTGRVPLIDIDTEPLISMSTSTMPAWEQSVKRAFDVVVAIIVTIISLPIMIYCSIKIKKESPGSIIFEQERIGKGGKPFLMYKFRTMYTDAENNGPQITQKQDKRITPWGRIMRKYRMDELPQLWNIIKGDMSIVGPRPERKFFIEQIEEKAPYYCLIYKIKPGLLSWGPIKIGYSDTIEKMIKRLNYDLVYMDNMSLLTDIKIMFYSIDVIIRGKGR